VGCAEARGAAGGRGAEPATGIEVINQHGRTVLAMSAMNPFLRRQVIIGPG
jgi:hypothetical protein